MASTCRITIDPGLLLSTERNCNGANAHKIRGYAHTYVMACFLGDEQRMCRARRLLETELIRAEYFRSEINRQAVSQELQTDKVSATNER
jgi:hypothetical protein